MRYTTAKNEIRKRELIRVRNLDMEHNVGLWEFLLKKDTSLIAEYLFESGLAGNIKCPVEYDEASIERSKACEFDYKGKHYVLLKPLIGYGYSGAYELLDRVHDTEYMTWTENKKYGTRECRFESGMFEFHCICQKDNTVMIDVKYTKCDNKHKNKVTVSTIEVLDADNKRILEAIEEWKGSFLSEVDNVTV